MDSIFLADLVSTIHVLYLVVFVTVMVLSFWSRAAGTIYNGLLFLMLGSQVVWLGCPLTALENWLRPGMSAHDGSFTVYLVHDLTGLSISVFWVNAALGLATLLGLYYLYRYAPLISRIGADAPLANTRFDPFRPAKTSRAPTNQSRNK